MKKEDGVEAFVGVVKNVNKKFNIAFGVALGFVGVVLGFGGVASAPVAEGIKLFSLYATTFAAIGGAVTAGTAIGMAATLKSLSKKVYGLYEEKKDNLNQEFDEVDNQIENLEAEMQKGFGVKDIGAYLRADFPTREKLIKEGIIEKILTLYEKLSMLSDEKIGLLKDGDALYKKSYMKEMQECINMLTLKNENLKECIKQIKNQIEIDRKVMTELSRIQAENSEEVDTEEIEEEDE